MKIEEIASKKDLELELFLRKRQAGILVFGKPKTARRFR